MKKKYVAKSSMTGSVLSSKVWEIWKDVNNWNRWDRHIEAIRLEGGFCEGGKIFMKGGAPDEIQINITNVKEGVGFSDMTELPFGHIKTFHQIEELEGGNIQITHHVEAIITGEKENEFFMGNIWPGMQKGLSEAVANIIKLAKS